MGRHQSFTAKHRGDAGGQTGTEDPRDVIERESDASFPASDAPAWTGVTGVGCPGSPDNPKPARSEGQ